MKASEIRNMTAVEIKAKIAELEEELFRLRFRHGNQPVDNPIRLRYLHRDVARLKTVLRDDARGTSKLPE